MGKRAAWKFISTVTPEYNVVAALTAFRPAWLPRTLHNEVEDFTLNKDDNGNEFLTFAESPTKTRQGGLRVQPRSVLPKMFATAESRCPVALFKSYLSKRPEDLKFVVLST